ncbi:hypothetical protein GOODEAATRI_031619, partial [Goodea atripinnis]
SSLTLFRAIPHMAASERRPAVWVTPALPAVREHSGHVSSPVGNNPAIRNVKAARSTRVLSIPGPEEERGKKKKRKSDVSVPYRQNGAKGKGPGVP